MPRVIHLVRHGQSEWNALRRVQGQTMDVALDAVGHDQARAAAQALRGQPIGTLLCSDQRRAVQTAQHIADQLGLASVPDRRLREQSLGTLEGLSTADALRRAGEIDWTDPDVQPGGGESLRQVHARLRELFAAIANGPRDCVLVSHGDTIRVALALLDGLPVERVSFQVPANGSINTRTLVRSTP
ncbi:MAG TPA: histidine phosphatase family protein [Jatrophihabitantaceae bacterium]|jgi:broad specificity phosphatase PhoE|nr:histidine phosphatase family protein [Jatrophihabitantaceae bacterium]